MLLLSPPNYKREDHLESRFSWVYPRKTEEEINKLARDVIENRIFLSVHIRHQHDLPFVFMPLVFAHKRVIRMLDWWDITLFYEYYDKAGPRSVNGYPTFFSMYYLDRTDHQRLSAKVQAIAKAIETALLP